MNASHEIDLRRRVFLKASAAAGAGLTLGVWWSDATAQMAGPGSAGTAAAAPPAGFTPNAFVRIGRDDTVTVICKHVEMGQGTYTGLATLVAEELDAAWSQVRACVNRPPHCMHSRATMRRAKEEWGA